MTTISAKVVADSVNSKGGRLTTLELRYPRFIHSEFMTHRVFSRNARSSRAVPVEKMLEEIENDPVIPLFWGKNQKGMQASEEHDAPILFKDVVIHEDRAAEVTETEKTREYAWLNARNHAVEIARAFTEAGYHKQVANRLLEPFMHIDTLVSATEWSNFLALRDDDAAEPHIRVLAQEIRKVRDASTPRLLLGDDWHLPYIRPEDEDELGQRTAIKVSVARCARISYTPFDGDSTIEAELNRYDRLVGSRPLHASPAEHQAKPDPWGIAEQLHGNFRGFIQYRKTLEGENILD